MPNRQLKTGLKILVIITQGELGGAQRYILDLAAALDEKSYRVMVGIGANNSPLAESLATVGVKTVRLKHLRRDIHPLADLAAIWEIKNLINKFRPDIVHLNSSKAGVLGSFAAALAGHTRVIFTAHGFAFLEPQAAWKKRFYFSMEKFASRFREKIITVSDFDRKEAIRMKLCAPKKLVTIRNGISLSLSSERRGRGEELVVGTIANLYKTKGLEYLIDAASILHSKFQIPNSKFIIIGEGPERQNLESRIENLGLEDKFKLLGAKSNAVQFLREFDIFVLPSVKEGLPYTILEAMAAGLPIIATSVGGIPELISPALSLPSPDEERVVRRPVEADQVRLQKNSNEAGILIPPADPSALAHAIKFLIDNPETAQKLGQNARERVKDFALEKMVAETTKIYESLSL